MRFGRWTVAQRVDPSYVVCVCECGTQRTLHVSNLISGRTKSCGCYRREKASQMQTTHGNYGSATYKIWGGMINRCFNERNKGYPQYGGRGITVCERWRSFENFLADMGERPAGMSIERIDNSGNYEPGNCRWATATDQARNTRRTKLTPELVDGIRAGRLSAKEVGQETGAARSTFYAAKNNTNWKDNHATTTQNNI